MDRRFINYALLAALCVAVGCQGRTEQPARQDTVAADGKDEKPQPSGEPAAPEAEKRTSGGWGSLKGRFLYDGTPPPREKINVNKDADVCGKFDERREDVVVAKDGGLANVVIWLRTTSSPAITKSEHTASRLRSPSVSKLRLANTRSMTCIM